MLRADPGSTCILSIYVDPMYCVQYKSLSYWLSLRSISARVKVMHGTCYYTRWHRGHESPSSFVVMGTCVRNNSESARASLSASFVSFERQSSSCRVIRAGILANCAQSEREYWVLWKDSSSRIHQSESSCAFLYPSALGLRQGSGSWYRWLGCSVRYLVVLAQVLFTRMCTPRPRCGRLCC